MTKRVVTIDVRSHCYFHEALNLMGDAADKVLPPVKGVPDSLGTASGGSRLLHCHPVR
jgi:hypothetical protein